MAYKRLSSQVLVGAVAVLVGIALLAETTGLYPTADLLRFVPVLFVVVGLYALVASGFRNVVGPVSVVAVAAVAQAVALDYVAASDVWQFWPLLVVLFGLSLVVGQYRARVYPSDAGDLSALAIFGGSERRATSEVFRSADLTAIFGGTSLDLRDAVVPEGETATIDATALFGGVEVVVPRDWNVELDVLPILGGASDDRARSERTHDGVDLVVTGFAAFGGVAVAD